MGFYKTVLGIETPEPGESPAATGQLKKMAEQIDALLRRQLTNLVELAKLKVTGTIELPGESLTTTMFKALAVTTAKIAEGAVTDAKVAVGRALIATGNSPGARTERAFATAYEPAASRMTWVLWDVQLEPSTVSGAGVKLYVDGVEVTELFQQLTASGVDSDARLSFGYPVPPGQVWEVVISAGSAVSLHSSYLFL